jgi:eukaryotic-like serine/threonine-protein kinase
MRGSGALGVPLIGQTLSHYRITAALGAGGMGEVYRATDTRLDREVAIKVLPASHAGNPQFLARFEREAKTISALNHPHVCTLHDVGCEAAVHYLVMELIEGESLADRLKKGALPVPDVLRYGAQIAGALEAAHRHGIVHRDLKPGNVMLTRAGAKLLDFGLARTAAEGPSVISAPSTLQTENRPLTTQGTILGTFQYMAPEQLEGLEADARTDIFALGALLYEMATGQRAFRGESKTSLIAAIVSSQPTPVSQVVPMTPPAFDHVVRTCLAKDSEDRWQSARDVKAQLEWIVEGGSQAGAPAVVVSRRRQREQVAWLFVAVLALATGALLWTLRGRTPPPQNVVRFEVHAPPGTSFPDTWWGSPIVSPDGRQLAFAVREGSGKARLWVRSLDSLETKPIPDSDEGITPFWSPDSRSIAFVSNGTLKAVEVLGGAARVIAKPAAFGGAWSRDGVILFNPESVLGPLHRVSASGGPSQPVTTVDARGEIGHCCARFLPDGRFIFYALGKTSADGRQYVGSLGSSNRTPLSAAGIYAPPGFLLDAPPPKRTLLARPFDVTRLEPTGDVSFVTTETLARFGSADGGSFSVSESGVLAYRAVGAASSTRLVWFDRTGVPLGQVPANAGAQSPELSPDGRRLLFERRDAETGQRDVWVLELDRGVESRLSFEAGLDESDALWSPDGRRIVWSKRGDTQSFQEVAAAGGAAGVVHDFGSLTAWPQSWSPDGRHLLFGAWTGAGQGDLMVLPLEKRGEPEPFVATSFVEMTGDFSPDGRWVAYSSDETGRDEVYIRPFPKADGQWRVSTDGGTNPRWRPDGRELFYIAPDRKLMSVSITARPDSPALSAPRPLFQTRISGSLGRDLRNNYAVSRDGQRFLIVTDEGQPSSPPITVIVNWPELLKRNK